MRQFEPDVELVVAPRELILSLTPVRVLRAFLVAALVNPRESLTGDEEFLSLNPSVYISRIDDNCFQQLLHVTSTTLLL
jgi:hypothetical protein